MSTPAAGAPKHDVETYAVEVLVRDGKKSYSLTPIKVSPSHTGKDFVIGTRSDSSQILLAGRDVCHSLEEAITRLNDRMEVKDARGVIAGVDEATLRAQRERARRRSALAQAASGEPEL